MSSQEQDQSSGAQAQRFDDPELGSGVRDTGVDAPESGQADRAVGTVDEDANPPMSDPTKSDVYGGTGELPPQDAGAVIPPYEGRAQSAKEPSGVRGRRWGEGRGRNSRGFGSGLQVGEPGGDQRRCDEVPG
jgi:hypothetical protein